MSSEVWPSAKHFEGGLFPPGDFELVVEKLQAGDDVRSDVRIKAYYDRHSTVRLEMTPALSPMSLLKGEWTDPVISGKYIPSDAQFHLASSDAFRSVLLPRCSPTLVHHARDAALVTAVVINGPSIRYAGGEITFREGDLTIVLKEFAGTEAFRKEAKLHQLDTIATGTLTLTAENGRSVGPEEAMRKIGRVARFLTLLRGGNCAIGHVTGCASDGSFAYGFLGFSKADPFKVEMGWCDEIVVRLAAKIYGLYSAAVSDADQCKVILRAIDYYRTSNVARNTSESVALVASYAALEALVPYVLVERAGWTDQQVSDVKPFAARLAAAVKHTGLNADPLQHSPVIAKRIASEPDMDVFAMLAKFRNRMTHYKKGFTYTGEELWEMWMISQWFCEILLLYLIGYRDVMIDRRRYGGWTEAPSKVPLS